MQQISRFKAFLLASIALYAFGVGYLIYLLRAMVFAAVFTSGFGSFVLLAYFLILVSGLVNGVLWFSSGRRWRLVYYIFMFIVVSLLNIFATMNLT